MELIRNFFRAETWRYLAAMLIPVILLSGVVVTFGMYSAGERRIARLEQSGASFLRDLNRLSYSLHQASLRSQIQTGDPPMTGGTGNTADIASGLIEQLALHSATNMFQVAGPLASLRENIQLAFSGETPHPERIQSLLAETDAIRHTVAERSTLILDPKLASYHLMYLQVHRLPLMMKDTTTLLGLQIRGASGKALSEVERARLELLYDQFNMQTQALVRDMRAIAEYVPELAAQVTPFGVRMAAADNQFRRLLQEWDARSPDSANTIYEQGKTLYKPVMVLYDEANDLLQSLLAEREQKFTRMLYGGAAGGVLATLAILYFVTGYYRASQRNLVIRDRVIRQLDAIGAAQGAFITGGDPRHAFERLLDALMTATGSRYGFMGDICKRQDGAPCLRVQAATEMGWNAERAQWQTNHLADAAVVSGLNSLVERVVNSGEPVILNHPLEVSRLAGLPPGHPPLRCLLAVPVFKGTKAVGIVTLANRDGGYPSDLVDTLHPFLHTFANILSAHSVDQAAREAELALRDSVVRHRTVLETMVDALITIDNHGRIETINSAAEAMFGYPTREAAGQPITLLMPDQTGPRPEDMESTEADPMSIHSREVRARRKDGSEFPAELSVGRMQIAGKIKYSGIVRDLTERKEAERALQESSEGMILAQQIAHLGHWVWDIESGALSWSEEIYRIFGLDPDRFPATYDSFLLAVHPEDRDIVTGGVDMALRGSRDYDVEHRVVQPDGTIRFVREQGEVTRSTTSGKPVRMVGTVHDITEHKKLEAELSDRVRELEASKREIQSFYHTLSHELKTPLTSAREFTLIIKDGLAGPLTDEQDEYLTDIEESCNQMTLIINDLVDATRLETGKLAIDPVPVRVAELTGRALAAVAERATQKGVVLLNHIPDPLPGVVADPHRITQVLTNLLTNALKFTPEGGTVEVDAERSADDPAMVAISVRDSGRGMSPEQATHVFQRFYQIDKGDAHTHQGLGLGLFICRELVQLHGGVISVQSELGNGSTFTFTLPADPVSMRVSSASAQGFATGQSH
ncbi:MAG: PAS domain S-box protein [Nitrospirota bacterium]|nr:PAS domain S-box protein [Nitrospirota bacterium]